MNRRTLFPLVSAVCTGLLTSVALASDPGTPTSAARAASTTLTLNGQASAVAQLGSTLNVTVTGTPGRPAALFLDANAGPTTVFGQSVALGFTGGLIVVPLGNIPGSGTINLSVPTLSTTKAHGGATYFVVVVDEDGTIPGLCWSNGADLLSVDRPVELAGNSLTQYPWFDYVRAINRGSSVEMALDPTRYPYLDSNTCDVYVVASKTQAQWDADPSLTDVAGGPQTIAFSGSTIQAMTITLDSGTLAGPDESATSGDTRIGVGYDVVIDCNQDGQFNGADLIDGYDDTVAGFYICRDTARGSLKTATGQGPYDVTEILYSGGTNLQEDTYYPSNIASLGQLPLVVISHGNGHNYQWYDHLGYHLASYGYIVMSHFNLTGPGSHTAADTTLNNTDYLIVNQAEIGGGVLNGHIDSNNITWIGHSRGGDGVARAYDKLFTGQSPTPTSYDIDDIKLVSSIAPVDFGGTGPPIGSGGTAPFSNVHDVPNYHLWVGLADADVNGCPTFGDQIKWHLLLARAERGRQSISLNGVGHGDFHDGGGSSVASGPNLIGRAATHTIMRGYALPLVKHFIDGDVPSRDFLTRQYEAFRAVTAATGPNVVANMTLRDDPAGGGFMIDDFQTNPSPALASSGATVTMTVVSFVEGLMGDNNTNFTWQPSDPFNGWLNNSNNARFRTGSRGCVFTAPGKRNVDLTYTMQASDRDFSPYAYLSFRAAQGTRHPATTAELGDTTFTVTLVDTAGNMSDINIGAYGGGVEEPYLRNTGPTCGSGFGWSSEFETIRIRLTDFQNNGSNVDLRKIDKLVFNFGNSGPVYGSAGARIGMDEIGLTAN